MNKVILYLFVIGSSLIAGKVSAFNFEESSGLQRSGVNAGYTPGQEFDPAYIIGQAVGILLSFIGVIFLGLMMYGGYIWMMARGNQAEVDKAKKLIESAIIGLIVVLAAYAITYFVGQALAPGE